MKTCIAPILALLSILPLYGSQELLPMQQKRVLFLIASKNFQQDEYTATKELLSKEGYEIINVSNQFGTAIGEDCETTAPIDTDTLSANTDIPDYDALVFIGGKGILSCFRNEVTEQFVKQAATQQKIMGAICLATRFFSKWGILKGKQATGWDGDKKLKQTYEKEEVIYNPESVVVDGHFITASGPNVAKEFAQAIIRALNARHS
jgi:putative intracellular protease/amidase